MAVRRARGETDEEQAARAVNAEPWEPLPGMVKLQCEECRYFFAAADEQLRYCPDCTMRVRDKERREAQARRAARMALATE